MIDVAFIGMGALSLRSAYVLAESGVSHTHKICMYEAKSTPARKILMAGIGGLNLTKDIHTAEFLKGYGEHASFMRTYINEFNSQDLISWVNELGISTFMGAGNKIFPKGLKATPFVRAILRYIASHNIETHYNHIMDDIQRLTNGMYKISFKNGAEIIAKTVIIATGGASYEKLGGNHDVIKLLDRKLGISYTEFQPFNVGVDVAWDNMKNNGEDHGENHGEDMSGKHLKSIALHGGKAGKYIKGDMVITSYGLEGMPIYAINQDIMNKQKVYIDLKADLSEEDIVRKINNISTKNSMSNRIRKGIKLKREAFFLLKQFHKDKLPKDVKEIAHLIKNLPLNHGGLHETNKSISSSGGVNLTELNSNLEVKNYHNLYLGGEMLNWNAITGGYLLTACFSMGDLIARVVIKST